MEEIQVIETTSGRQFKPWATKDDVQDPASVTAIASEIASGKQAIAAAINAKGGSASAAESFTELAQSVEEIPNLSDMAKLAGIIAGGDYNKNPLQGHNENVKYGKTEIADNLGAFETINVGYCFQYWDLLKRVDLPSLVTINSGYVFANCSALQEVNMPNLTTISGGVAFFNCSSLQEINMPNLTTISGASTFRSTSSLQSISLPSLERVSGGNANASLLYNSGVMYVYFPKLNTITYNGLLRDCPVIDIQFGTLVQISDPLFNAKPALRNITIGQGTNTDLPFQYWTATNVIEEGQSGIDELNNNLQANLISKLYQGGGKILRLGASLYDVTTQETRDMITAKGWTLQRG